MDILPGGCCESVFAPAGAFARMRFQTIQDMEWLPDLHLYCTDTVKQSVFFYQLEGLDWRERFPASELEVETFASMDEPLLSGQQVYPQSLLTLSLSDDERAVLSAINGALAVNRSEPDALTYSQAATDHLRRSYGYSMRSKLPDLDEDPVITWLREGRLGHCEYFATAFILLARDAGFPARMVVGFAGGSWNSVEEYFVVRNDAAHAWAEIYDASTQQWLRVDPTPGGAPLSDNRELALRSDVPIEAGMSAWVDSLRIQWYRRIVDFDQDDQVQIALSIKELTQAFFKTSSERVSFGWVYSKSALRSH